MGRARRASAPYPLFRMSTKQLRLLGDLEHKVGKPNRGISVLPPLARGMRDLPLEAHQGGGSDVSDAEVRL